jgi:hypothetical protein
VVVVVFMTVAHARTVDPAPHPAAHAGSSPPAGQEKAVSGVGSGSVMPRP